MSSTRLALKLFRGEPAISELDWNFSAIHSSSPLFSTDVWFGPPRVFYHRFNLSMDRSPGFGSIAYATIRPVQTRFPCGSGALEYLNLAAYVTRRSVLQKVRGRISAHAAPSACKHRVSGSLSLPSRGTFHLSLTVLFAIGHQVVFSLGGGPPCFPRDYTCPVVLWIPACLTPFRLQGFYPLWRRFPSASTNLM
jgi:hypothetical protein